MKPGNQSARGAGRSSWGSLSGFALYFFPRDGDEADDAVASTSLATHTTVGQGHPRKPRLEHATHAPRPSRIVAEHWRWGARHARGTP
ncbi:hypothetical protein LSM04_007015 [Trypanosoma melophagium]|uniref:uncharacterized protein n=1 Tax=Trypanosoma melophagium TaxID=715481 RepID=UPI00351A4BEF|nr:hypothetical protein LSM04_007015 [Trypanosoma melophagium]